MRIAYARLYFESNALSPVLTTLDEFRATHFLEGEELAQACGPKGKEVHGFLKNGELSGFVKAALREGPEDLELVPLFSTLTVPAGPLSAETYRWFEERLLADLEAAQPLDGVFLALHGSMCAEGIHHPEARLLEKVRALVGDARIAISLDMHANITRRVVRTADVIAGYRTNPHRDHAGTGARAGAMLMQLLQGRTKPTVAWRSLPMLLGGGLMLDFWKPMRAIFQYMKSLERDPRVLDCSLFQAHLWNDHPDLGWTTYVVTQDDPELAERLADELAERCWAVRHEMPPQPKDPSQAIAMARGHWLARSLGAVCLVDASDAVGAGATGENTRILEALINEGEGLTSYVPLRDPAAVEACWEMEPGQQRALSLGGGLDPDHNDALEVEATLLCKKTNPATGRALALAVGDARVVVTEGSALALKPSFFSDMGLNPWAADILVVKSLFPWRIHFLPWNRRSYFVKTSGITDLDAAYALEFTDGIHPRDEVACWRPADRRRRGVTEDSA
jgi:microcystin degradation protein MlrC